MSEGAIQPDPSLPDTANSTQVPTNLPTSPEMPAAGADKLRSLPISSDPKALLAQSNEFLERLTKLVRTTAGLRSLLSTLSYSLYIAAYVDANAPSRAQVIDKLSVLTGRTPPKVAPGALNPVTPPVSRFAPYIGLLNDTRFAMGLTNILPMITLLKGLLKNPPKDKALRTIARVQVTCYIIFTVLENMWFLASKNLLPTTLVNRLGGQLALLKWSCRPWLVAILCDFARLGREAQLSQERKQAGTSEKKLTTQEEEEAAEKKWYGELFASLSYFPMSVHYSLDSGLGLNTGMVGLSGFLGGSGTFLKMWAATKE